MIGPRSPAPTSPRTPRRSARLAALVLLLSVAAAPLLGPLELGLGAAGAAPVSGGSVRHVAANSVTGGISGPTSVGPTSRSVYHVTATGGPALAANGTIVGTYSYSASIVGANTSGGAVTPPQGVLLNGAVNLTLLSPNATEPITLYVDITSSFQGQNSSANLSYAIDILAPIVVAAGLKVVGPTSVKPFSLAVELDGSVVGKIAVPSLTSGQNYPLTFSYLGQGLSPGWHTFSISVAQEHGFVLFSNGQESYSVSFYVPGGTTNYGLWILAGIVAFGAVVFIWTTQLGARRRSKGKN